MTSQRSISGHSFSPKIKLGAALTSINFERKKGLIVAEFAEMLWFCFNCFDGCDWKKRMGFSWELDKSELQL